MPSRTLSVRRFAPTAKAAPARAKVSRLASFKRLVTAYADYP
ncbi:hypothetical protein ACX3VT_06860 [Aerococcus sanguinicola]|nr:MULTISPECIES: hypothetical protein [unclassified Aerococcus]MDK6233952.1 hypothetical protein [Aerococcus sp. UMB10185]MDK6856490.1 hypothetical protein [Aerococcus sp. UMB7533]MDK8502698.1 hypothetical protein [Aerococcus sp. UMB1112A]